MLVLTFAVLLLMATLTVQQNCTFTSFVNPFFFAATSRAGCIENLLNWDCRMTNGDVMLLAACGDVKLTSGGTDMDYSIDEGNGNNGLMTFTCNSGSLDATGYSGGGTVNGVTKIQFNNVCCRTASAGRYSAADSRVFAPDNNGALSRLVAASAQVQNCYQVSASDVADIPNFCRQTVHTLTTTTIVNVGCNGNPGDIGTWDAFPSCIPFSEPAGGASVPCSNMTTGIDRPGHGIGGMPPSANAAECCAHCLANDTCHAATYAVFFGMGMCFLKDASALTAPEQPSPTHPGVSSTTHGFVIDKEAEIICPNVASQKLPCSKWCDGTQDCTDVDNDERGCPTTETDCKLTLAPGDIGPGFYNFAPALTCDGNICNVEEGTTYVSVRPVLCAIPSQRFFARSSATIQGDPTQLVENCISVHEAYSLAVSVSDLLTLQCTNGVLQLTFTINVLPSSVTNVTLSHFNDLSCTPC